MERMIRPSGNHDILKNFPGSGEIDYLCAFPNKKATGLRPWVAGLSGFVLTADGLSLGPGGALTGLEPKS